MIKLHFKGLKALNFKKVLNRKAGIIGAAALIITAAFISLSLTRQTSSAPQAKGVSTTVSDNKSSDQTGTDTNAPVTTEAATPSSPSASTNPTSQPASNTKKPTAPQTKSPTPPGPAPSTPRNPSPAPSPTPQPTYRVTLHPDQGRVVHYSFGKQLQVPFTVTYDPGFVKADYRQPGCSFLVAPSPSHGMLCDVSQKEADTGFLVMQYNDATAKGYYKVQMSYPIGNTVRTDSFEFNFDFN
jgi:hypothetical protein